MVKQKNRERVVKAQDGRNIVHPDFDDETYKLIVESAQRNHRSIKAEIEYWVDVGIKGVTISVNQV